MVEYLQTIKEGIMKKLLLAILIVSLLFGCVPGQKTMQGTAALYTAPVEPAPVDQPWYEDVVDFINRYGTIIIVPMLLVL